LGLSDTEVAYSQDIVSKAGYKNKNQFLLMQTSNVIFE
jgi:hypothetical protein